MSTETLNLITMRDRIFEIRESVKALQQEEVDLIEKIASLGFKLKDEEVIPKFDPANLKVGDKLLCIKNAADLTAGIIYSVLEVDTRDDSIRIDDDDGGNWWYIGDCPIEEYFTVAPTT